MSDASISENETLDDLELDDESSGESLKPPQKKKPKEKSSKVTNKTVSSGTKFYLVQGLFIFVILGLIGYVYLVIQVLSIVGGDSAKVLREAFASRSGASTILVGDLLLTPDQRIENLGVIRQRTGQNDHQNALEFLSTMAENTAPDIYRTLINPTADETLLEENSIGTLPIISEDGRSSLITYARPFNDNSDTVEVSIVVNGLGISQTLAEAAIKLKPEISLAFSPYSERLDDLVVAARKAGHEILIELPMEPYSFPFSDPGPYALRQSLSIAENISLLEWVLSRTQGYIGLTNFQGNAMLSDPTFVSTVLPIVLRRGLTFVEVGKHEGNYVKKTMTEQGHFYTGTDVIIDIDDDEFTLEEKLRDALQTAKEKGRVTIAVTPFPLLLIKLALWINELPEDEYTLTPISSQAQVFEARRLGLGD